MSDQTTYFQLIATCPVTIGEAVADEIRAISGLEPVLFEAVNQPTATLETVFEDDVAARLTGHLLQENQPGVSIEIRPLEQRDWTTFWRHHFKPMAIGNRTWIAPEWDQEGIPPERDIILILNPGLSFGTGNHFTTRFCLEVLDDCCSKGPLADSLLDAGCGSGVIAIAAAQFGIRNVIGVDFDPVAVQQSLENAARNPGTDQVQFMQMDLTTQQPDRRFTWVFANLYDELLMRIAPQLVALAEERLVLTGIREFMADAVLQAFEAFGWQEIRRDSGPEWAGLMLAPRPQ